MKLIYLAHPFGGEQGERGERLRRLLKACSTSTRIARFIARYTPQGSFIANLTYLGRHGTLF